MRDGLKRGRDTVLHKLIKLLFHRAAFMLAYFIGQFILFAHLTRTFSEYFAYFYWFCMALSVVAVLVIISNRSDPGYKIAWIILILLFPLFGGLGYAIFGGNRLSRGKRKKLQVLDEDLERVLAQDCKADTVQREVGARAAYQCRYLETVAYCPAYSGTKTTYFPIGEDYFAALQEDLKKAKRYIFVEYFIIHEGKMWNTVLDILREKVREGLDVRVMYDDIGCLYTLPQGYFRKLEEMGIRSCVFNPLAPVIISRLNNRDHRKFCIMDGTVAYTGGINLADEYINEFEKYGHWKDSGIRVEGEAAWSMTVMFLSNWNFVQKYEDRDYDSFRPTEQEKLNEPGFVQPYCDNPLDEEPVGQTVYLNLISKAEHYLYITTPYLIIDSAMNTALCNAAKAGVDVRIITPHIPDKPIVFELTRAHYAPLMEAGVKIYEYTPGFIHAKSFVVDDRFAAVGSVNLDYRSLFLHLEDGVLLYDAPCVADIKADFRSTVEQSQLVDQHIASPANPIHFLVRSVLRILGPLM